MISIAKERTVSADSLRSGSRKKILFANIPADGHFNPLTSLAVHLKKLGYDVRWYAGPTYAPRVEALGIPVLPFVKAKEVTVHNIDEVFPERNKIKNPIRKLNFDICSYFIARGEEFYADIKDIYEEFSFDLLIADNAFTGLSFVRSLLKVPILMINVMPLSETSRDLPPPVLGMEPSNSFWGRKKQDMLKWLVDKVLLKRPNQMMRDVHARHGIDVGNKNLFDVQISMASAVLLSGTPGFEYYRSDMSRHIHFVGPLLPYSNKKPQPLAFVDKIRQYDKVILVTQGTFEGDSSKLIRPTLEAFKGSNYLIVVTTAGWHTKQLRQEYKYDNIIIEDFIPFSQIMPFADVYVSNGGYGGVLLSISNKLPMVVAGIHEGKNEICARVGYFRLGINLRTERPKVAQLRAAVEAVLKDEQYRKNVEKLSGEFARYDPLKICEVHVERLLEHKKYGSQKLDTVMN